MADRVFWIVTLALLGAAAISFGTYERWIACNELIEVADHMAIGALDDATITAYQNIRKECIK